MKTPEPTPATPAWAAENLPEQGQEDLRRLMQFGGGSFDVEAGLAAFEERMANAPPVRSSAPRSLLLGALVLSGVVGIGGFAAIRGATSVAPVSSSVDIVAMATASAPERAFTASHSNPMEVPAEVVATSAPSVSVDALPSIATAQARRATVPTVTTAPKAATQVAPAPESGDRVEAEVRHASKLRIVARTDPRSALSLAAEGDKLFPDGLLHAEREAIAVEALARLDRSNEAVARANAFADTYPTHPRTGRIRAIARGERPWEP